MRKAMEVLIFALGFLLLILLWMGREPEPCQKDAFFVFKGTQLDCEARHPKQEQPDLLAHQP
jgi:hypothetical protein